MVIYVAPDLRSITVPDYEPPGGMPTHITVSFAADAKPAVPGLHGRPGMPAQPGLPVRCTLLTPEVWRDISEQVDELEAKWERGEWGRGPGVDGDEKYRTMVARVKRIMALMEQEPIDGGSGNQ